mmetsp:Transcript_2026/g.5339  ORF Transcript_2026/g.5339 Transcript_2026/m.5339 type:complete len:371 (+) Transcript_2026:873-1985(+)
MSLHLGAQEGGIVLEASAPPFFIGFTFFPSPLAALMGGGNGIQEVAFFVGFTFFPAHPAALIGRGKGIQEVAFFAVFTCFRAPAAALIGRVNGIQEIGERVQAEVGQHVQCRPDHEVSLPLVRHLGLQVAVLLAVVPELGVIPAAQLEHGRILRGPRDRLVELSPVDDPVKISDQHVDAGSAASGEVVGDVRVCAEQGDGFDRIKTVSGGIRISSGGTSPLGVPRDRPARDIETGGDDRTGSNHVAVGNSSHEGLNGHKVPRLGDATGPDGVRARIDEHSGVEHHASKNFFASGRLELDGSSGVLKIFGAGAVASGGGDCHALVGLKSVDRLLGDGVVDIRRGSPHPAGEIYAATLQDCCFSLGIFLEML